MPLVPGLSPSLRQPAPPQAELLEGDIMVEVAEDAPDQGMTDAKGNVLSIEHGDGSVTVSIDGSPLESAASRGPRGWFDNLVDDIEPVELSRIADDHTPWEGAPLAGLAADGQLEAFEHTGFWQPMDTLREKTMLEELWQGGRAPWKVW